MNDARCDQGPGAPASAGPFAPGVRWALDVAATVSEWALARRCAQLARGEGQEMVLTLVEPVQADLDTRVRSSRRLDSALAAHAALGIRARHLAWDVTAQPFGPLEPDGSLWRAPGPAVLLVHDAWTRLPQRLLAVHYGQLLEWRAGGPATPVAAGRTWRELGAQDAVLAARAAPYLDALNSAEFTVPPLAAQSLLAFARLATHGWLSLACAPGWASVADLREGLAPGVHEGLAAHEALAVNFDWIARALGEAGASVWQQRGTLGHVVQLASDEQPGLPVAASRMVHAADHDPAQGARLIARACERAMGDGAPAQALGDALAEARSHLAASHHDPRVLASAWDVLAQAMEGAHTVAHARELAHWAVALRAVWNEAVSWRRDGAWLAGLARCALACQACALAREACELLRHLPGADRAGEALLAQARCLEATGQAQAAQAMYRRVLIAQPASAHAACASQALAARETEGHARATLLRTPCDGLITLEPLAPRHARALLHQYRDPQIAAMTGLPAMTDLAGTQSWIGRRLDEPVWPWVVIHREQGLAGYVDFSLRERSGFLCFWIGVDFQGQGLARRAATLACREGFAAGLEHILTSAFDDNTRSLRALRGAGFEDFALRALAPHDDRTFLWMKSPRGSARNATRALRDYYSDPADGLRFAREAHEAAAMTPH